MIKVSRDKYFDVLVEILNPVLKLKTREKTVLVALLKVYNENRHTVEGDKLNKLLFDTAVRRRIRKSINMSEASYNNHLLQLKKKRILDGNSISKVLCMYVIKDLDIRYSIKVL